MDIQATNEDKYESYNPFPVESTNQTMKESSNIIPSKENQRNNLHSHQTYTQSKKEKELWKKEKRQMK